MHILTVKKYMTVIILVVIIALLASCFNRQERSLTEQYEYDSEGKLISRTPSDGSKIKYKYNTEGLPIEIDYPDGPVRYGYDENGNRIWMQNKSGKTEYKYDAFDRITEVIFRYSLEKKLIYEYDPWDRKSAIKILDGQNINTIKYEYNIVGNLISIDFASGRIEYSYHPEKGEIIRKLPNGIKTIFSFSPPGELTSLKHLNRQNELIASYRYEYYPPGKISRVFEETPDGLKTTKYEWDNRGYLKRLYLPNGDRVRYEYDAMGNRISKSDSKGSITCKYDNFGRLLQAGDTKYEWAKNGNLIAQIERNGKTTFRYDARNLPALVKTPDGTTRYSYDADGNMVVRWKGKEPTYFLPNPLAPPGFALAEYDKTGKLTASYLYGDVLLGQGDKNGQMQYFLEDGFNSIRHIADMNGKIIGQRDYTPFGEPISIRGSNIPDFRMAGERFLPEIKSYFIGNRLYQPNLGGYLTPDPSFGYMERPDSFNKYAHGCSAPGIFMEPRCNQTRKINSSVDLGRIIVRKSFDEDLRRQAEEYQRTWWSDKWLRNPKGPGIMSQDIPVIRAPTPQETAIWKERDIIEKALRGEKVKPLQIKPSTTHDYLGFLPISPKSPLENHPIGVILGPGAVPYKEIPRILLEDPRLRNKSEIITDPFTGKLKEFKVNNQIIWKESDEDRKRKYKDDQRKPFGGPGCPPFCDNGGGGPKGPRGLNDPFKSIEAKLGGIKLDATAQFAGNLGKITGAVYDPEKQVLVLVGDENTSLPSIKPEDLAVALMLVYGPVPQDPQFTLDPDDPRNPRGKWLKAVYMPEQIIGGTEFGKALFEADWLLKQYSFGVRIDENGRLQDRKSSVSGFKSNADLALENEISKHSKERWNRFWIVVDDIDKDKNYNMVLKQSKDGKAIYFDTANMRVKSKKTVPDPSSPKGLRDVDNEDDPIATKFATLFTKLYDEIAKESPEFERVRQLAKAVAIAKWMKKEGIPFDTSWVNENANKRIETIGRITVLSTKREKRTETPFRQGSQEGIKIYTRTLYQFGGVDLTVKPKYITDDIAVQSLQKAILTRIREKDTGPKFNLDYSGKPLQAVVLPISRNGQALWKDKPIATVNGIKYQFDMQGKIGKSIGENGDITEYTYDANQKLKEFKVLMKNGWIIGGNKKEGHSEMTATDPQRNKFYYHYNSLGNLDQIKINDKRYAEIDYNDGDIKVNYGNIIERFKYDNLGRIKRYEIHSSPKGTSSPKEERINLSYDKDGNVNEIRMPDTQPLKVTYFGDKIKAVSSADGKVEYSYDTQNNRLREINTTWGESIKYDYEGKDLSGIRYQRGEYYKIVIIKNGFPTEEKGANEWLTKYKYTANQFLDGVIDPTGASGNYLYDNEGQIKQLKLPDGTSINFQYELGLPKGKKEQVLKRIKVTYTSSKVSSSPVKESKAPRRDNLKDDSKDLAGRMEDIKEALKKLRNGLILDLLVDGKDLAQGNIADSSGDIHRLDAESAKELRRLLKYTAKTHGRLGKEILEKWERFYNSKLALLVKPTSWTCPDGKEVRLKPILIIKTNEVTYQYANLEKVPALANNFIIFIASRNKESLNIQETSANDLVNKINRIPTLSKGNVAFVIRLPKVSREEQAKWEQEIRELEKIIGKEKVLFNPSKEGFERMLQDQNKEIMVIEITHTDKGITLKGNEIYTSKDLMKIKDLSHIRYLIGGSTCSLPYLENGNFAAMLREKGVGIMNTSYREVSTELAFRRFEALKKILVDGEIEKYDFPAFYLFDIIDQKLGISGQGTTNLGKMDYPKLHFLS